MIFSPIKEVLAGVTPKILEAGMTLEEAETTFVCRKLYSDNFDMEKMSADTKKFYKESTGAVSVHTMYIAEILDIL